MSSRINYENNAYESRFDQAMDDDFNTPEAIAVLRAFKENQHCTRLLSQRS